MRRSFALALLVPCLAVIAPVAWAQEPDEPIAYDRAPAHIEFVDGTVTLDHDGRSEAAVPSALVVPGDRVRTDAGRAEILFGDNSALYLDERSAVDLLSDSLIRLMAGRMTIVVAPGPDVSTSPRYQVDTPSATVRIDMPGEYRIAQLATEAGVATRLGVVRGAAQLASDRGAMNLRAGELSIASDDREPGFPEMFNAARWDDFDRWTAARQQSRLGVASSQYLPSGVQAYASTFDQYGAWGQDPAYGAVWYPTAAYSGWRPYTNGYWNFFGGFGWTWIGFDRWAWPTHHYGRWGFRANTWFWIPSRRWAPAWVHWAAAPGYVSWCPLGFDGRPVFPFWNQRHVGSWPDPWRGWTVLPRHSFGSRSRVTAVAVDGRLLTPGIRSGFVVHDPASLARVAVPRTPFGAGRFAGSPTYSNRGSQIIVGPGGGPGSVRGRAPFVASPRGTFSVLGVPRTRATTRVDSPAMPYGGMMGVPYRSTVRDDPYGRAERVARERLPGIDRQPLRSIDPRGGPGDLSPYPPQFQSAVPQPFRAMPRSYGSTGSSPWGSYQRGAAMPGTRGFPTAPMMRGPSSSGSFRSSPAPVNRMAVPRSASPGAGVRSGVSPSAGGRSSPPPSTPRTAVPR